MLLQHMWKMVCVFTSSISDHFKAHISNKTERKNWNITKKETSPSFLSAFALPFFFSKIFLSLLVTCLVTEWLKEFEILMICAILFEEQCQYQELRSYRQDKSFLNYVNILFVVYHSLISSWLYRKKTIIWLHHKHFQYHCILGWETKRKIVNADWSTDKWYTFVWFL